MFSLFTRSSHQFLARPTTKHGLRGSPARNRHYTPTLEALEDRCLLAGECAPAGANIAAWWPAEDNASDVVGTNHGTLRNGATFSTGTVGKAFSLDGSNDFVSVAQPIIDVREQYTLEAWILLQSDDGGVDRRVQVIMNKDARQSGGSVDLGFFVTNRLGVTRRLGVHHVGASTQGVFSNGQIPLHQWTHVAVTYDGAGTERFYINGQLDTVALQGDGSNAASGWQIGGGDNRGDEFFQGRIDEPTIYSRALTPAEIQSIYLAGSAGKCGADIAMLSAELQGANTVEFTYEASGNPGPFDVGLYRSADGITYNTLDPIQTQTITPNASGQGTGSFSVGPLASDPNLPYLLVVADPSNIISEADEDNNSQSIELPDIVLLDATTEDFKWFQVDYQVLHSDAPPFTFGAYLSSDETFDPPTAPGIGDTLLGNFDATLLESDDEVVYRDFLLVNATVQEHARFVIIVADPDKVVPEVDDNNNSMFALPIFAERVKGGFLKSTGVFEFDTSSPAKEAAKYTGAIEGRISRGTADFDRLENVYRLWSSGKGKFKNEEAIHHPTYAGDDWRVQSSLVEPLTQLVSLIDIARNQGRFTSRQQEITDSFDEEGEHSNHSLHYEGRAIDFADRDDLGKLAGLALLAGFQFVFHEPHDGGFHLHVSQRGWSAEVSKNAILAAIDFGYGNDPRFPLAEANRLITNDGGYSQLRNQINALNGGPGDCKKLSTFLRTVHNGSSAALEWIREGFKEDPGRYKGTVGLLTYNAQRLENQLGCGGVIQGKNIDDTTVAMLFQPAQVTHEISAYDSRTNSNDVEPNQNEANSALFDAIFQGFASNRLDGDNWIEPSSPVVDGEVSEVIEFLVDGDVLGRWHA